MKERAQNSKKNRPKGHFLDRYMKTVKKYRLFQGGESRDFLYLYLERVRKLFIIFLILNEFPCSKVEIPCLYSRR